MEEYQAAQTIVADTFDAIFAEEAADRAERPLTLGALGSGADEGALTDDLRALGFADPAATAQRVRSVLDSRRVQAGSETARSGLTRLVQRALQAAI